MKYNQLKIGVILSYITMITQNIVAIIYTPIMLRLLGQNEYGLYQLVASVVSYLGLLSFGFGSAYVRFYSRFKVKTSKESIASLNAMFMIVFIIIGIIALLAGSILVANVENFFSKSLTTNEISVAKILMFLMTINLGISFPSSVFDSYVTAHECYFFQRVISLLQVVLNPFLAMPLLLMGYKSISLVVATTILTLSKLIVNYWYCTKKINMQFCFTKMNFSLFKEIGLFSFFIFINMIVDQINWSVDKFILGILGGTTAVAIYAIGGQINAMYISLSSSISSVFIPRVNKIVAEDGNNNKELTDIFTMVGRIQFMVLALVVGGFFILGKFFITIWAGNDYNNAYYVALLLIIPVTVPLIQNLGIEIQKAKNMHKFRSIIYFFIAIGNMFISIPLSKYYGEIGAAFGTMITMVIGNIILMNWYYHVKIKLNMKYFWKNIFTLIPAVIYSIVIAFLCAKILIINSLFKFIITGLIYVVSYTIFMYFFGMNSYEKNIVKGPINKILRKGYYDKNRR